MTEYRERLIDEVKRCPVLYDTNHENHRDIVARERCWAEIGEKMDVSSDVLKREWKILRDCFRQALRRSKSSGRINKNATNKNEWRLQSRMSFLVPFMSKRVRRNRALARLEGKKETNANNSSAMEFEHESNEEAEAEAWSAEKAEAEADARADRNSLELFFASVCASARRLPTDMQRDLKRSVLDTLLALEARSETITSDPPDLKPKTHHY